MRLRPDERHASLLDGRRGLRTSGDLRITFVPRSGNTKIGPIPTSISTAETCPPTCSFFGAGCYAEGHFLRKHWQNAERGLSMKVFAKRIAALPSGTVWRHNVMGDLPGEGNAIDVTALMALVNANTGRRGFTFTHKNVLGDFEEPWMNRAAIGLANEGGFAVNLSADNLGHADKLAELGVGPVVVVLPSDAPEKLRTPKGRRVVVCPAQTRDLTCADCELCTRTERAIVGFRAHGNLAAHVSQLVQIHRKEPS